MFSCEFYEISKNTLFTEHLLTTACRIGDEWEALLSFKNRLLSPSRFGFNQRQKQSPGGIPLKSYYEKFHKMNRKHLRQSLRPQPATLKKEAVTQVFSCEFCETFKDTLVFRTPPVTASVTRNCSSCSFYFRKTNPLDIGVVICELNWSLR